jgi:(p)ppGpp synthase/HD superfamily hydrolase
MPHNNKNVTLGPKFEEAFIFANRVHAEQTRKTSGIPYISHLMSVAALVIQDGGSETEAIAALLHDAAEDHGEEVLEEIREQFGEEVAQIVEDCSDTFEVPKPPWEVRKKAHIAKLRKASPSTHRVVQADKLHNARSLLRELRIKGEDAWDYFNGGKHGTIWYYNAMYEVLGQYHQGYLWWELSRVVERIERLASEGE